MTIRVWHGSGTNFNTIDVTKGRVPINDYYYTVYLVRSLIDGKFYVGKHKTKNLQDGYLGSGVHIRRAIKKHGKLNFRKDILYLCTSEEEMDWVEKSLVDESFINHQKVYNLSRGGKGGLKYLSKEDHIKLALRASQICKEKYPQGTFLGKHHSEKTKEVLRRKSFVNTSKLWTDPEYVEKQRESHKIVVSSPEHRKKLSDSHKGLSKSEKWKQKIRDSNRGKKKGKWATNGFQTIYIKINETIPEGYRYGRTL